MISFLTGPLSQVLPCWSPRVDGVLKVPGGTWRICEEPHVLTDLRSKGLWRQYALESKPWMPTQSIAVSSSRRPGCLTSCTSTSQKCCGIWRPTIFKTCPRYRCTSTSQKVLRHLEAHDIQDVPSVSLHQYESKSVAASGGPRYSRRALGIAARCAWTTLLPLQRLQLLWGAGSWDN